MWVPAYDTAKIPAYARLDRKRHRGEYEPLFPGTGVGRRFGRYLIQYRFLDCRVAVGYRIGAVHRGIEYGPLFAAYRYYSDDPAMSCFGIRYRN